MRCLICGKKSERCHIKSRGAGGPDDDWNILDMCRFHHTEQHTMTWKAFRKRYPIVDKRLAEKGWYFMEPFGRHWNDKLTPDDD